MSDYINGTVGGIVGTILSHPIDTIRIMIQTDHNIEFKQLYKRVYRGLSPPLIGIGLEKSLVFGTFYTLNRLDATKELSIFNKGMIAGLVSTIVVSPVEQIKILLQTNKYNGISSYIKSREWSNNGIKGFYNGWSATLFREVPGYGLYFFCYENIKDNSDTILNTFLKGSLSGIFAWAFIYPSDYIKTLVQNQRTSYSNVIQNIWIKDGFRGFYKGCSLALLRCIPLHGGVFVGYEMMKHFKFEL